MPLAWVSGVVALAWYTFYQGHPYRIRYIVPAVAASSILIGLVVGHLKRWQAPVAGFVGASVLEGHPWNPKAAMVPWKRSGHVRAVCNARAVATCLPQPGHGEIVMASVGALAHYMQELSAVGFALQRLHEGNGEVRAAAVGRPK